MNLPTKKRRVVVRQLIATLAATVLSWTAFTALRADEPAKGSAPTPELEAKLVATLTNATLKGRWCGIKDGQLGVDKEDSYNIVSIKKLDGDNWQINARMAYGGRDVELPVPAQVKWAGDTPVLLIDNVSLGSPRSYSARLMIYEKTYSGWWSGTDHGGMLNGVITNAPK